MMGWKEKDGLKAFFKCPACDTRTVSVEDEEATVQLFYYVYNAKCLPCKMGFRTTILLSILSIHLSRKFLSFIEISEITNYTTASESESADPANASTPSLSTSSRVSLPDLDTPVSSSLPLSISTKWS